MENLRLYLIGLLILVILAFGLGIHNYRAASSLTPPATTAAPAAATAPTK